tara:strand:- start:101 stop:793 length:693 start_codon:yes stop_codon:yes gene_type:complete
MTIAEKHLSKHGRFGDTEISNTSTGELWHVNKHEKKLIDDYGIVGERLVDISGSGTINPNTGLKEQFLTTALMAAQLGVSLYQGYKQSSMERDAAQEKKSLTESQLSELQNTSNQLGQSVSSQLGLLTEQTQMQREQLTENMERLTSELSKVQSKSGFASSSDIEEAGKKAVAGIRDKEEGLMANFGAKVGDVFGMFESEKSRIRSERDRLESEKGLYDRMSNSKFLGIF